ncbi:uncharacterized protein LOC575904 [Strongylocentrotus purpuratus]|uniref:Protein quiver n=1 Tax=Strongylocentrotus purpuratus TaxID=7668 RepID=A0A7M7THB1_STRPU|nr:uncharacterized protein LOC575904 [Strongylocentrotus purpuratus]|eukprot:XP_799859.1 PREDICTED: uncharacterized protein LOC575904 [Strongylocentrotus purpuratus]
MKSGILLLLSALMCVLEQGTCQLCYSCLTQGSSVETSPDLTECGTVNCHVFGGCAKLQLSAVSTSQQGVNETTFITYRDCGTNLNRCGPISQESLDQHSALAIIIRARYTNVNFANGRACNCNKDLCNSAISSRMSSQYLLLVLVTFTFAGLYAMG